MLSDITSPRRAGLSMLVVVDVLLLLLVFGSAAQTQTAGTLGLLGPIARDSRTFWAQRVDELCPGERARPTLPPQPPVDADPTAHLGLLADLVPAAGDIWRWHQACLEPRTVVIAEDLLHFRVSEHDQYETDPTAAFARIRQVVDEHVVSRRQVHVMGHTDDTFTDDYNDLLSFRRALEVASLVRRHLESRGWREGIDFAVFPIGLGESRLLPRRPAEGLAGWRMRCRRIELSFRSAPTGVAP